MMLMMMTLTTKMRMVIMMLMMMTLTTKMRMVIMMLMMMTLTTKMRMRTESPFLHSATIPLSSIQFTNCRRIA